MTLMPVNPVCAVCGATSRQLKLTSIGMFGASDLDLRPAEMARSTLPYRIQECPSCGYCSGDVSKEPGCASRMVHETKYVAQLASIEFPVLANRYACYAMILERVGDFAESGWAALQAAWVCDDAANDASAAECRRSALSHFAKASQGRQRFAETVFLELLIVLDLLRRVGQFERALKLIQSTVRFVSEGDPGGHDPAVRAIRFEKVLCEQKVTKQFTFDDVPLAGKGDSSIT